MLLSFHFTVKGQEVIEGDFGLGAPVFYSADDSIVVDVPNLIIKLYGNADVKYESVHLTANLIEIDIEKSEVEATYSLDSLGKPIGKPEFTDGTENVKCDAMKYNFKSEKAIITEVRTQQGEGYIHMQTSKRQPNEELHFKNGKYTTCDREKPHYHFQLSKAIVVPEKRIVTGPLYMRILNVPLPIAAPFAVLPNSEKKKHGIILPRFALGGNYGPGLENLGYYIPINKHWETYIYGTIFTTGRWALNNQFNYKNKYKNSGTFKLGFERLKGYFFDENISNNYSVFWNHNQNPKAHPSLRFSANIDFRSNNNPKQSIEVIANDQFNTSFNSAISLNKGWKLKKLSGTWSSKVSLQQNSQSNNFVFELPSFNFSVNRFDLGVLRKNKIGKKWYESIAITYTVNSLNRVTVNDSIARTSFAEGNFSFLNDYNSSGVKQFAVIQTNLKPKSGWFNFNLKTDYTENWNFQTFNKSWNSNTESIDTTLLNGFAANRNINFSGGLSTNLYGYYKSKFRNGLKLRHVMAPNVSFTYRPDIGQHQEIILDTLGTMGYYSPFDISLYREASRGESGLLSFGLSNTLEMKKKSRKDTLNQEFKNTKLIDRFNIGGSYDLLADSLNLSNIRFSFQTTPVKRVNIQSSWVLSPYQWIDSLGQTTSTYAWDANQGIGNISNANFSIGARHDIKPDKGDTLRNFANSVWTFNIQYNLNFRRQNGILYADSANFDVDHTVNFSGTVNLWKIWNITYDVLTDLESLGSIPNPSLRLGISRELHCWETSLNFTKNGNFLKSIFSDPPGTPNYIISFKINIKSSMFDAFLPEINPRIPGF
ncbi:MAG: putative LPS assembly protein LptD [Crocinitomicaceae bacterium]